MKKGKKEISKLNFTKVSPRANKNLSAFEAEKLAQANRLLKGVKLPEDIGR